MRKKVDPRISEYYRKLAKKGVKKRHERLLEKLSGHVDKSLLTERANRDSIEE